MKKLLIISILATSIFILYSCGGPSVTSQDKYFKIFKNMPLDAFKTNFTDNIIYKGPLNLDGTKYQCYFVKMQTAFESEQGADHSTSQTLYYNEYYFVFKDDKLHYNGFLYEFQRHNNSEINKLGHEITKIKTIQK